ncbi:SDR family oxidoreductase [Spongiibacter sp. KMU-158]|uniref:SDR family oxidoreductase n=1 Tax=Spongiibacter pelagi TaxID=2760804 RepID=A0A927C159_9GAMM|nr:SDR family oxidoreductase [Spongiibacter pelagi]MBD2857620.1 SDR family oxidoreductase [Spongiibacter pelagi]
MNLHNKKIAITGAARGLGFAMAKHLGEAGAIPLLIDLNPEQLNDAVDRLKSLGIAAQAYTCNVANEEQVDHCFSTIVENHGQLDGLINNAGILRDGMLIKVKNKEIVDRMSLSQWQSVIDVNLTGVFLCGRAAAEQMIKAGNPGVIINISSIAKAGNTGQTNYSAAKAGVAAMAVTWANELARYGIRCAAIAPGFIMTDMVAQMKPEALERMTQRIPLRRMGQVEEIAHSARYIFENDYYSGRIIELDGGLRL